MTKEPLYKESEMEDFEKKYFDRVCDYIRFELLGHPKGTKCPRFIVMRTKGFSRGTYFANNKTKSQETLYDYRTIYYTCVYCKDKILNYFHNNEKKIKDDEHKANLIFRIIEQDIDRVYNKLKENKAIEKRVENTSLPQQDNDGADYTTKSKINERLQDLL